MDMTDTNKKLKELAEKYPAFTDANRPVDKLAIRHSHCEWRRDEDGIYETACGNMFEVIEGTTVENGMVFCPYCGGLLNAV